VVQSTQRIPQTQLGFQTGCRCGRTPDPGAMQPTKDLAGAFRSAQTTAQSLPHTPTTVTPPSPSLLLLDGIDSDDCVVSNDALPKYALLSPRNLPQFYFSVRSGACCPPGPVPVRFKNPSRLKQGYAHAPHTQTQLGSPQAYPSQK
jgi:hypothetical protein